MSTILVTDGESRPALAIARSLGRAGHQVYITSSRARSLAGASRYVKGHAQVPDPLEEPDRYLDALSELVQRWQIETMIPVTEPSLLAILAGRHTFPQGMIPFPSYEDFHSISDKRRVLERAAEIGIAVPRQGVLTMASGLDSWLEANELSYPVVLKPSRSVGVAPGISARLGVSYASSPTELQERITSLPSIAFPLLLQELIRGPGLGVFLLIKEGRAVASFAHRRLREKPPSGGVSVLSESVPLDPELRDRSAALLKEFNWDGPAMVEYKVDLKTGTPYLMEVNGRFWGSLQLAVDSGVDFPRILLNGSQEDDDTHRYRTGVRLRWWLGDLDQLLIRLRRPPVIPDDRPGRSSRHQAVLEFMRTGLRPGTRNEIFRLSDPLPALREAIDWFRGR